MDGWMVKLSESFLGKKSRKMVDRTILTDSPWPSISIHNPGPKQNPQPHQQALPRYLYWARAKTTEPSCQTRFTSLKSHSLHFQVEQSRSDQRSGRHEERYSGQRLEKLPQLTSERKWETFPVEIWKILCSVLTQKKAMWFQISDWQTCLTLIAFLTLFIIIKQNQSPHSLSCFASRVCWYFEF